MNAAMSKRARKPAKKREQPWMKAAREKLHANDAMREEAEIRDAFMALAGPELEALGRGANAEEIRSVLECVRFAWNLPILHALSTEPGSDGAMIRADAEQLLERVVDRQSMMPLFTARVDDFGHLRSPIAEVFAHERGHQIAVGLRVGDEIVPAGAVLDIGDTGWPKASRCLISLSEPARDLLPDDYGLAEGEQVIGLAVTAWNLHLIGRAEAVVSNQLREETLEAAERARALPEPMRGAFEAMVQARQTRFAHDPRAIFSLSVTIHEETIRVQAAAVASESQMQSPGALTLPSRQMKEGPSWLSSLRRLVGDG